MTKLFCLTTIRERRVLTLTGWIVFLMTFGSVLFSIGLFIHPFLAPIKPVGGDILVVEGWLPNYALEAAKKRFQRGGYKLLITIGGKLNTRNRTLEYGTWSELAASKLTALGLAQKQIMAAPVFVDAKKDRTYHAILALQIKLKKEGLSDAPIDLISLGAHARRTWFLMEKVFPKVNVGVIAIFSHEYDASEWWLSSEGVRSVISEAIAYLYARFIFSLPLK
jgi:hypothetical protein